MGPHGGPRDPKKKKIRSQKFGVVRLRYRASLEPFFFSIFAHFWYFSRFVSKKKTMFRDFVVFFMIFDHVL